MLQRLARFCYRRRRVVLLAWIVLLVLVSGLSKTAGGKDATTFSLPGTESQKAFDLLKTRFPSQSGDTGDIVFASTAPGGVLNPSVEARMESAFTAALHSDRHVVGVSSPYGAAGVREISPSHTVAFAAVQFDTTFDQLPAGTAGAVESAVRGAAHPDAGLDVQFGGDLFEQRKPPGSSEGIGLLAGALILLLAFGSLLAMVMPLFIAMFAIAIGLGLIALLANFLEVASFTGLIAAMIGIGVGIDYALFIVTRFRQQLHDGMQPEDAIAVAISTSGRAVLFAGTTVVIALLGMFIMGLSFIDSLGLGAALAVLVTVIASLTLLPAMLGFIGYNIDRFALPGLHRTAGSQGSTGGFWYRWSRHIQSRPWPFAIGALALLLVLVAPVASLRLGNPDAGNDPPGTTTRLAYDLLAKGFGPGYNGPLTVATSFSGPADLPVVERMRADLLAAHDVASVGPVVPNSKTDPTAAIISVTPKTSPESAATASWVRYIRADVLTPAVAGTDVVVHSGGSAAISIDLTHRLGGRLPWFFGAVIALSFLLLMSVFRSVLVPLKAAIMNLLSIGASFGILVAVFQWGWGASLIGVAKQPITSFSPMMLFAILFGLSMDYEVFLLSRIKEEHDRSHNNAQAVADGLAATARVITAAAAIMVTVFMTFVFQPDATAKLIGLGLAVAILIDATVVRMVLVPATMELLGEANWWLPSWLDRVLPRLAVDGGSVAVPPSPESGSGESPERVLAGR